MTSLHDQTATGEPTVNPSELIDVSPAMCPVVLASRQISDQALDDATGTNRPQRRAAVNAVVEAFVARHYRLMPIAGERNTTNQNETSDPATVARFDVLTP